MKNKQRWRSLLTAVLMVAALVLPGTKEVLAAGGPDVTSNAGNVTANVGDVITIPITFSSTSNDLRAIHGEPAYDTSLLEFQTVEYSGIPAGMESTAGGNFGYVTTTNFSGGTINVKFKVLKCTSDPVTVTFNNLYYSNSAGLDGDSATVTSTVTINHPTDQNQVDETKATCTSAGHRKVTCGVCNTVITDEDIPALGHDAGAWKVVKEATCTEKGTKELRCTRDDALLETEEIPLTAHKWDSGKVTKEATCTEKGIKTFTCEVCKDTKTEEIPVTAHTFDEGKVTKEATCTQEGEKLLTCKDCGATKTEVIPVVDHTWKTGDDTDKDGWKVVTEATTTKEGVKERVCSICGEKETQAIQKLTSQTANPTSGTTTNPTTNKTVDATKTGDTSVNIVYILLILVASAGIAVFILTSYRRKVNRNN